jgi:hypothetical protein
MLHTQALLPQVAGIGEPGFTNIMLLQYLLDRSLNLFACAALRALLHAVTFAFDTHPRHSVQTTLHLASVWLLLVTSFLMQSAGSFFNPRPTLYEPTCINVYGGFFHLLIFGVIFMRSSSLAQRLRSQRPPRVSKLLNTVSIVSEALLIADTIF